MEGLNYVLFSDEIQYHINMKINDTRKMIRKTRLRLMGSFVIQTDYIDIHIIYITDLYTFTYIYVCVCVKRLIMYGVGFDHGLPCRVKNMARGTQETKTEAEGRGFFRY